MIQKSELDTHQCALRRISSGFESLTYIHQIHHTVRPFGKYRKHHELRRLHRSLLNQDEEEWEMHIVKMEKMNGSGLD